MSDSKTEEGHPGSTKEGVEAERIPTPEPVSIPVLEDIFPSQLILVSMVSRPTQTDWAWKKMALRWGHAKALSTTSEAPEEEQRQHGHRRMKALLAAYPTLCCVLSPCQEIFIVDCLDSAPEAIFSAAEEINLNLLLAFIDQCNLGCQGTAFLSTLATLAAKQKKKYQDILDWEQKQREMQEAMDEALRQMEEDKPLQWEMFQKRLEEMNRISFCRDTEKCVDTTDLLFDPFDMAIHYTMKPSMVHRPSSVESWHSDEEQATHTQTENRRRSSLYR